MLRPAASRHRLARTLNTAYGDGLLSEETLAHRLDELFGSRLIDPARLIGDLTIRSPRRAWTSTIVRALEASRKLRRSVGAAAPEPPIMLGLDWSGTTEVLLIGRHPSCDVVLTGQAVSRRHARLRFRDGTWVLQDLDSTNGTWVNNARVGRCKLLPGDHLEIGDEHLLVD
jgi:FHA domain